MSDLFDAPSPQEDTKAEMLRLGKEIEHHQSLYHTDDNPEISDGEYDAKVRRYRELRELHPSNAPNPADNVGAAPSGDFTQHDHAKPMMSLDNVFSLDELTGWVDQRRKMLGLAPGMPIALTSELKFDGVSISLRYEDHVLSVAATRGNGQTGEVVTANARTIKGIPHTIPSDAPRLLEVRGEVLMPKDVFLDLNESLAAGKVFANPRKAPFNSS